MSDATTGVNIERDVPLAPLTSWIVGGPAEFLARPQGVEELRAALTWARVNKQSVTLLSGGTNVLVSDQGVRGLVICLRKMSGLTQEVKDGRLYLECLAGTSKSELLKTFLKHKLEPALFLAGIPGDVGGGVAMNAGVAEKMVPREFVEIVDWIEVIEGEETLAIKRFARDELEWSYRHCEGWKPGVISRVGISWAYEPSSDILERVKQANKIRLSKQPLDMPSCGSVFRNPPGTSSGRVIEEAGLKGYKVGGAQVSLKHANFIVNVQNATALDIHSVIRFVQTTVREKAEIDLQTEVVYVGEWS